jgi:hypothetical protein
MFAKGHILVLEISLYGVLYPKINWGRKKGMKNSLQNEVRWRIVKSMLDEFPELKNKTKAYVLEQVN